MTVRTALLQGVKLLEEGSISVPRLTAEVLLSHVLREAKEYLYTYPERELSELEWIHYGRYLHERLNGRPTQYITGRQEFYGREFRVTSDVLIPRPETEHVVEATLSLKPARIIDVGCGSGAIAVSIQLETGAEVFATDISPAAVAVARKNGGQLGASVNFAVCDVLEAVADHSMCAVVSNPPYVPLSEEPHIQREIREHEPRVAVFSGASGFEIYERLLEQAQRVLRPGGHVVLELGFNSRDRVVALLGSAWRETRVIPDLAGIPRVLVSRLP